MSVDFSTSLFHLLELKRVNFRAICLPPPLFADLRFEVFE